MSQPAPIRNESNLPELLAPAGSPEAFRAAVAAGADAVYLSGKRFGARKYAQNFTEPEIEDAIARAHTRGVRLYVTVNTLVHDRELVGAGEYLIWLYSIGADAVLVQDIGIAELAREIVPDLPLHASTQMTIHNTDGVRWAREQGFFRVVLARELSLYEVETIAHETRDAGIGLEVFAHGALCYCYSGQCLLSSLIGGRSGNRGMCAQPCRKPYTLVTGNHDAYGRPQKMRDVPFPERYLLSPKDLCTYQMLDRLVQSPVVSLKIEGRMRSPEYVAIVVAAYRQALDAIAHDSNRALQETEMPDLMLAFNRGFTTGYLFGERYAALMGRDLPDNRGLLIGTVSGYNSQSGEATVLPRTTFDPAAGDGLVFRNPDQPHEEFGFSLNTTPRREKGMFVIAVPRPVRRGTLVVLTSNMALTARAHRIIATPSPVLRRPVEIDLAVKVNEDGIPVLDGVLDAGKNRKVKVSYTSGFRLLPARTHPLTVEQFEAQLRKTGGTPFAIRSFTLHYPGGMFAPVAELNRIRREFLSQAKAALTSAQQPSEVSVAQAQARWAKVKSRFTAQHRIHADRSDRFTEFPKLALYADCIDAVRAAATAGCNTIYFEPGIGGDDGSCREGTQIGSIEPQLASALAICRDTGTLLVWKLPRITRNHELDVILSIIPRLHIRGLTACMVEGTGAAFAVRRAVPDIQIAGSVGLNIFNHRTVLSLAPQFFLLTLSPELSAPQIGELIRLARDEGCDTVLELVVQGNAEAMVSEDCLLEPLVQSGAVRREDLASRRFFGIRDKSGRIFPVRTDGDYRTHIFNAVEMCLVDHIPALMRMGIGSVAIDARGRTAAYARQMVLIYREALATAYNKGPGTRLSLTQLKERAGDMALGGITTGHFMRGLKEV